MQFPPVLNNNIYFSLFISFIIICILYFQDYNKTQEQSKLNKYGRIFIVSSIVLLFGLYIRSGSLIMLNQNNNIINGGASLEDINLDDPGF